MCVTRSLCVCVPTITRLADRNVVVDATSAAARHPVAEYSKSIWNLATHRSDMCAREHGVGMRQCRIPALQSMQRTCARALTEFERAHTQRTKPNSVEVKIDSQPIGFGATQYLRSEQEHIQTIESNPRTHTHNSSRLHGPIHSHF